MSAEVAIVIGFGIYVLVVIAALLVVLVVADFIRAPSRRRR